MKFSCTLVSLFIFIYLRLTIESKDDIVACRLSSVENFQCDPMDKNNRRCNEDKLRIIAIGDIHGNYESFLKILYFANITIDPFHCKWSDSVKPTLLVQLGDLPDRGLHSLEAFKCLKDLQQSSAEFNSKVIRLVCYSIILQNVVYSIAYVN